ncbi:UBX domain-containing protein 11 isoform X2 [Scleropages formosus]|uniref:UBX domain-containing protein 11 isoform X2 n=1 Tax=Scleropages formosus TaxID=113540 RepID=UPI000877F54F|nr:UBX domain-containing protein 11 isoform X2 [Scleropages formosus]
MSCPLSTLGKHRRAPLPGWQHAPRRRDLPPAKHQAAWLNEFLSPQAKDPLAADGRPTSRSKATQKMSPNSGSDLSDSAFVSSMMQRVGLLERTVHRQALDIQQKDKKIAVLEEQLKLLRSPTEEAGAPQRVQELERSCRTLQEQVWEMERFLSDYGMVWVGSAGDSGPASPQEEEEEVSHGSGASVNTLFCVDFDLVLHRVRELNALVGEGECHVEVTQGGARLARRSPVPLALYSNGIVMFEGPFRPYEEPGTQQCILDLMDGYFPSELQGRFPDGVAFQVFDRRHEAFQERPRWAAFPGKGQVVGGAKERSPDAIGPVVETHPQQGCGRQTEHFLNRLPERVVKAGLVVEVRDALRSMLQGSSAASWNSAVTVVDTPTRQASDNRTALSRDVTTLRLRSEDGQNIFVLQMLPSDTIGQVRRYLDAHRGQRDTSYDIMSAFPQRRYDDDNETLAACGLTQNTTLLLRTRPHQR